MIMNLIVMIIVVAIVTILVFILGIFIGAKKTAQDFQEKLETAWRELNWYERDFNKLVKKLNKYEKNNKKNY